MFFEQFEMNLSAIVCNIHKYISLKATTRKLVLRHCIGVKNGNAMARAPLAPVFFHRNPSINFWFTYKFYASDLGDAHQSERSM